MLAVIKLFFTVLRKTIMLLIIVALLVSNGLSLYYSSYHDALYSLFEQAVPTKWVKHSPTNRLQTNEAKLKTSQAKLNKLSKFKKRASKITGKVSTRAVKSATLNLGGAFTEAIPVIGIATIVGLTAMDIKHACENMQDMQELNSLLSVEENSEEVNRICGMKPPTKDELTDHMAESWEEWVAKVKELLSSKL